MNTNILIKKNKKQKRKKKKKQTKKKKKHSCMHEHLLSYSQAFTHKHYTIQEIIMYVDV